ncbi:MAG: response regulator transcription factor [Moraxellaceae bacterium]
MHVLIVEDDPGIASALVEFLSSHGHVADWAAAPGQALALLEDGHFDVMVLDRGLPRLEGLRLLEIVRKELGLGLPVLVLTARDTEEDKLEGFAAGADDYVVKPFSLAEVEARLLALQRRGAAAVSGAVLRLGVVSLDRDRHELRVGGELRSPGPKVMKLIELLLQEPGRVLAHAHLEDVLWGEPQANGDRLRQVLYQARKQLEMPTCDVEIVSVHGRGYRMEMRR